MKLLISVQEMALLNTLVINKVNQILELSDLLYQDRHVFSNGKVVLLVDLDKPADAIWIQNMKKSPLC